MKMSVTGTMGWHTRELAASFATAVTEQTPVGYGWIAKNGEESLYRIFQQLLPQV